jgi:hypothetical protein
MSHQVKIERARRLSTIGQYPASFSAVIEAINEDAIAALPSKTLAKLVDSIWRSWGDTKALAEREAIADGGVWDTRHNVFRGLA